MRKAHAMPHENVSNMLWSDSHLYNKIPATLTNSKNTPSSTSMTRGSLGNFIEK